MTVCATTAAMCIGLFTATPPAAVAVTVQSINASVSSPTLWLSAPVVGVAATITGKGYWRALQDGSVLTAGDAHFYGSAKGLWHDAIIAIVATPTGNGYWLADRSGGVYAYGDARYRGSMAGHHLNKPIVGMAATASGNGYWLVASDGGLFAFHAPYHGSMGGRPLNKPIVGMSARPGGGGYWEVASDGGIFSFGDATFRGSMGGKHLNQPIVGMAPLKDGTGYTMVAADGGLFRFGHAPFYGSAANACNGSIAVGLAVSPGAVGYWITFANARTYAFSPATKPPLCGPDTSTKTGKMQADLLQRLNQERAARGLAALKWDPWLAGYATLWSSNMSGNGFRHSNIGSLLGPYNFVGENIAMGSRGVADGALHNAWMHSDGHRSNMLAPGFTAVGIGAYCAPDGSIWLTQEFGRPASAGAPPPSPGTPPVNPVERSDSGTLTC
ncbi:MAG TPA: CAP domain-containing protein [Acidimicrobiia bacterium]|nr:CAP domain-containing protein [Acidimicrobiia bacterium]